MIRSWNEIREIRVPVARRWDLCFIIGEKCARVLCAGEKDSLLLLLLFASTNDVLGSLRWERVRFPRLKGKKKKIESLNYGFIDSWSRFSGTGFSSDRF